MDISIEIFDGGCECGVEWANFMEPRPEVAAENLRSSDSLKKRQINPILRALGANIIIMFPISFLSTVNMYLEF